ncbi:MAG: hypothetical protein JW947_01675, partial [Sedimentisphaerales bacterium]|nr:hypothetical protein [Sedimentisphaerales bacterium]
MVNDNMRVVFIRDGDDYWRFVRVIACTVKKRHLLPLLGAGLSFKRPSYLPLAQDLIHPLKTALWRAANPAINDIRPSRSELQVVKQVVDNARLERILDALHQTHGDGALAYLSVLNSRYWNSNHSALAAMAHEGLLPVCITLNFDLLIEEAVSFYGSACITECPLTKVTFEYGKGLARLRIIKPHGSFAPSH